MKSLDELNLKKKKYIIFDMDGTLIDSVGVWNYIDYSLIRKLANVEVDSETIRTDCNKFFEENYSADVYLEYCGFLIEKYKLCISKEELYEFRKKLAREFLQYIDFKPYVKELLDVLKQNGFMLILATNSTQNEISTYSNVNEHMKDYMKFFDLILTKENVVNKKPHPEIYLKVLAYFNASSEECLVFEDSLHGVMSSKNVGIETINIYDEFSDSDRLRIEEITDYFIRNYNEFLEFIKSKKLLLDK